MSEILTEARNKRKKSIILDRLNNISYADDPSYLPSDFAFDFLNFIKMVKGGGGEESPSPPMHYKILDTIDNDEDYVANLCHRGSAKTTISGEYLILYLAVYGRLPNFGVVDYGLYVSDSVENGVKKMRLRLQRQWDNSEFLKKYIPNTRFTDIRWYFKNIEGKELVFSGYGAQAGIRGTVELGTRPQLAILDDLISDEDARSDTVIKSIKNTIDSAIDFALHPKHYKVIWSGTPFNAKDPLYQAVESGAWSTNVFPVCEKFPCTREEFRGSWKGRFDYDDILKKYNKAVLTGSLASFNQELMLRIMSEDERLVKPDNINWYSRNTLLRNKGNFNFYITTDFATSEKESADYSFISVWGLNSIGSWYWVDGICKKQDMGQNVDDLFLLNQKWKPLKVGVEVSGQQGGYIPWLKREMLDRNQFFTLARENNNTTGSSEEGFRPNTNKMTRFMVALPLFETNKVWFPQELRETPAMIEMMDELELVAPSGFRSLHDDAVDTISMLPRLAAWRPDGDSSDPNVVKGDTMANEMPTDYKGTDIWENAKTQSPSNILDSYVV